MRFTTLVLRQVRKVIAGIEVILLRADIVAQVGFEVEVFGKVNGGVDISQRLQRIVEIVAGLGDVDGVGAATWPSGSYC